MAYKLVILNPKTLRPYKRMPPTYRPVMYGIQGPRGAVKPLSGAVPQPFTKKDYRGLQADYFGKKEFILYEELTRRVLRDSDGRKIPKRDAEGKIVYHRSPSGKAVPTWQRAKKITFGQKLHAQKPVLYSGNKRVRDLDIGYKPHKPRDMADNALLMLPDPEKAEAISFNLSGDTIREALKNLNVNLVKEKIYAQGRKEADLSYSMIIRIYDRGKLIITIPAYAGQIISGFSSIQDKLNSNIAATNRIKMLANLQREMAASIRQALTDNDYRFSSMVSLRGFAKECNRTARAYERLDDQTNADRQYNAADRIIIPQQFRPASTLKYLDRRRYTVNITVRFEILPY
jgi:hypothetical protein